MRVPISPNIGPKRTPRLIRAKRLLASISRSEISLPKWRSLSQYFLPCEEKIPNNPVYGLCWKKAATSEGLAMRPLSDKVFTKDCHAAFCPRRSKYSRKNPPISRSAQMTKHINTIITGINSADERT